MRRTKVCKHCGKEYLKRNKYYCSKECSIEARVNKIKINCAFCGEEFETVPSNTDSKFCSLKCKAKSQEKKLKCICKICGKEFIVFEKYNSGNGGTFCSQKCVSSQKIEKVCKHCCKTFKVKPSLKSQEFCNVKCKKLYSKNLCKRICEYCGKEFYVDYPSVSIKFCSKECRNKNSKVVRICLNCGKKFETRPSKKQRYCSLSCSNSAPHKVKALINNTLDRISSGSCISKTELLLKEDLEKYGFESQYISDFGSIDFAHTTNKIAVFVDGVFWHGREDNHWKSTSFASKIKKTKRRDSWQNKNMPKEGWVVLRYWDDYVRKHTDECVSDILSYLSNTK